MKIQGITRTFWLAAALLAGCEQSAQDAHVGMMMVNQLADTSPADTSPAGTSPVDTSPVLVTVNGEPITEKQFDLSLNALMGQKQAEQLNAETRQKVLQSLVFSRLVAQNMKAEISPDERQDFDYQAAQYKEKLFVNAYLKKYAVPDPVTDAMIADYYEQHRADFGGEEVRKFELLEMSDTVSEVQRQSAMARLNAAASASDWALASKQQSTPEFTLRYSQSTLNPAIHNPNLVTLVKHLTKGKTSHLVFIDGKPVIARVTQISQGAAVPLQQVQSEIRERLLSKHISQAITRLREPLLAKANVVYTDK